MKEPNEMLFPGKADVSAPFFLITMLFPDDEPRMLGELITRDRASDAAGHMTELPMSCNRSNVVEYSVSASVSA